MNTLIKFTLALIFLLIGSTQGFSQWGNEKVNGNGNITTKEISTSNYDGIRSAGPMYVSLVRGNEGTIRIDADENLMQYIEVEVSAGILEIKIKKNYSLRSKKGIKVTVPFESISSIALVGSGDIVSKDTIQSETMDLSVTGSGDIKLKVDAGSLDAKITGSGDMDLSGNAQNLEVKVTGSGDFNGATLQADDTEVYVSGSGNVDTTANKSLKARVNGSGDVRYAGTPEKKDTKVSGSGTVKTM